MSHRRSLLVALALLVTFVAGATAPAHAAALSKGAVKKIAAKVVAKAAPTLSVGHATTADKATTATTADKATQDGHR